MNITIERIQMSGRGPKYLYKRVADGKTLFTNPDSPFQSFSAWTRKKDAQAILDSIHTNGLEYVTAKLREAKV